MNGGIDPITLIFLVIAIVLILKIRSELGKHDDFDRSSSNFDPKNFKKKEDNVIPLREDQRINNKDVKTDDSIDIDKMISKTADGNKELENNLKELHAADERFNPDNFILGAKKAYEMIVAAYAEDDRDTLKKLLADEVFTGFEGALDDRADRGHIVSSTMVGISVAEIKNVELEDKTAQITVKFISEMISATHDNDGELIDGDPAKVQDVTDIWTFSRQVDSENLNWRLVATGAQ